MVHHATKKATPTQHPFQVREVKKRSTAEIAEEEAAFAEAADQRMLAETSGQRTTSMSVLHINGVVFGRPTALGKQSTQDVFVQRQLGGAAGSVILPPVYGKANTACSPLVSRPSAPDSDNAPAFIKG